MFEITRLSLPVQPDVVPRGTSGGWLPVIAGLRAAAIKDVLRKRWSATFQLPHLTELAAAVLQRELVCLSVDSEGDQWLSFEDSTSCLHVAPPLPIPTQLRSQFPFDQIPGLAQFVENFGGLANWPLPPCPWFVPADHCRVVAKDCDWYDWGAIGQWAGSLTLYNTRAGNFIVVAPDDRCAKWDHDTGWEQDDEDPFCDLGWSMSRLVEEFVAYVSLPETEAGESPFYY